MRVSPPTALSGTASASPAANEAYRNAQIRAYQQPSPSIDDFINTIGPKRTGVIVAYINSASNALASFRSGVSNPSVN